MRRLLVIGMPKRKKKASQAAENAKNRALVS